MPPTIRVLVVEDEQKVANALKEGLEGEAYDVTVERTGEGAFFRVNTETFDIILLDLGLPGRDGIEILAALRQRGLKTPVLVLTARDSLTDRVQGLDAGADDYLVKPFAFAELLARLRVLLRRGRPEQQETVLRAGGLELDLLKRRASRGGVELELKPREFEVLEYLVRHKNQAVTREMLGLDVWKEPGYALTNVI